ncbi:MAG: VanZ family protein [Candidatus Omnitrophica bacterium]|nr:VanZ family protein [Candidatus Omnitrophota bacterium]
MTRNRQWWWSLTGAYATVIAVGAVIPVPSKVGSAIGSLDKLLHLCEYLLLAWCTVRASRASGFPQAKTLTVAFLFPVGFGVFLEAVQGLLPYRSAELGDIVANTVGAGLGVGIGLITRLKAVGRRQ